MRTIARKSRGPNWPSWQAKDKNEKYVGVPISVLESSAFRKLSGNQIRLLFLCWQLGNPKARNHKAHLPRNDYPGYDPYQKDQVFYMSLTKAIGHELYADTNRKYYSDMAALEKYGFIKCLAKGGRGKASIYMLVDGWKTCT